MNTEIIEKLKKEAGNDPIKKQIAAYAAQMAKAAPETENKFLEKDNGIGEVYNKMRAMRQGPDEVIIDLICKVYKLDTEFETEMRIVKKENRTKIIDILDLI